jgi:hypothetical protein
MYKTEPALTVNVADTALPFPGNTAEYLAELHNPPSAPCRDTNIEATPLGTTQL